MSVHIILIIIILSVSQNLKLNVTYAACDDKILKILFHIIISLLHSNLIV